jgi:hypothetical protein
MSEQPTPRTDDETLKVLTTGLASVSGVLAPSLAAAVAALAFFFWFQGTLLVAYPTIRSALSALKLCDFPAGKVVITLLCLLPVVFNFWSYKIVCTFIGYLETVISSGKVLEEKTGLKDGFFTSVSAMPHQNLFLLTGLFFWVLSLLWIGFLILVWV